MPWLCQGPRLESLQSTPLPDITTASIAETATTTSSAIAERPHCRVGQFWPKVEDDILQTL